MVDQEKWDLFFKTPEWQDVVNLLKFFISDIQMEKTSMGLDFKQPSDVLMRTITHLEGCLLGINRTVNIKDYISESLKSIQRGV